MSNKLIHETSPYLLQHVDNPVNWYPWGDEAFQLAKERNCPIFLSIGYSTCHWCHVMARESFADNTIAELLNQSFISIKVDRETRPDIDSVYMNVCQSLTGSGGWPLTIFMTPEKLPFFAGTYFPPQPRYGQPSFPQLLTAISTQWATNQSELIETGNQITNHIRSSQTKEPSAETADLNYESIRQAAWELQQSFDKQYGGFGSAPKFPSPHNLLFLLRCYEYKINPAALEIAEATLKSMYKGGLFDHVGGGFSRYSTDSKWLAPHFEKMLYDNAMLTSAYAEIYQITKDPIYQYIIETTLDYVEAEMTSPEHGFYSAQDADSEGEEGKYYTWTLEEIRAVFSKRDGKSICRQYDITAAGNFEGKNILNRIGESNLSVPDEKTKQLLVRLKQKRKERYHLHKDDKILTAWNALMAAAYAKSGKVLGNRHYIQQAQHAVTYIEEHQTDDKGFLHISNSVETGSGDGMLDDYAFLLWAYLELYDSTFEPVWLEKGIRTGKQILSLFADPDGGLFMSAEHAETLLYRPKEYYDGAIPSGNSAAAYGFARLRTLTGHSDWEEAATKQLTACVQNFHSYPSAHCFALTGLLEYLQPHRQLVCCFADQESFQQFQLEMGTIYATGLAVYILHEETADLLLALVPDLAGYWNQEKNETVYYLCQNHSCLPPFQDLKAVLAALG